MPRVRTRRLNWRNWVLSESIPMVLFPLLKLQMLMEMKLCFLSWEIHGVTSNGKVTGAMSQTNGLQSLKSRLDLRKLPTMELSGSAWMTSSNILEGFRFARSMTIACSFQNLSMMTPWSTNLHLTNPKTWLSQSPKQVNECSQRTLVTSTATLECSFSKLRMMDQCNTLKDARDSNLVILTSSYLLKKEIIISIPRSTGFQTPKKKLAI